MDLYDCWMIEGEIDPEWPGHYLQNEKYKVNKVMHNVTLTEGQLWHKSVEVLMWAMDVEARGLVPSHCLTLSAED